MTTLKDAYSYAQTWGNDAADLYNMPYDPVTPTAGVSPAVPTLPAGGSLSPGYQGQSGEASSAVNYPKYNTITPYTVAARTTSGSAPRMTGTAGAGQTQQPFANVQMSKTTYAGKAPEFEAPEWDEGQIKSRTQTLAAVGLRQLRMALSQAMTKSYENPNVRRMVLRDALAGYGIGVAGVIGQAQQTAHGQYTAEYARQYQTSVQKYQAAWQNYASTGTQMTTAMPVYDRAGYDQVLQQAGFPVTSGGTGAVSTSRPAIIPRAKAALQKY